MDAKRKNYCKWGVVFALLWNVLILSVYTITCLVEDVPFNENIEVDSWSCFYVCYALMSAAWFYIGYALRKEYVTKKEAYASSFNDVARKSEIDRLFKLFFIRQYSKQLTNVFIVFIPFYILHKIRGAWEVDNYIILGIFIVAAIVCKYITIRITRMLKD